MDETLNKLNRIEAMLLVILENQAEKKSQLANEKSNDEINNEYLSRINEHEAKIKSSK